MKRSLLFALATLLIGASVTAQKITSLKTFDFNKATSTWCITKDSDNGFIIGGSLDSDPYNSDVFLMKVDSNGDSLWTVRSEGEYYNSIREIIALNDTTFVGIGTANSQLSEQGFLYGDVLLLSVNTNGNVLWKKQYSTTRNDEGYGIIKSSFGGMIACGLCDNSAPNSLGSYWILRLNDVGDTLWTRSFYMGPSYFAVGVCEDDNGNIQVVGLGGYIVKLDKDGTLLETNKIGNDFSPRSILEFDNSLFIAGRFGATGLSVGKYDQSGNNLWNRYSGGNFFDFLITQDTALLLIHKNEAYTLSVAKYKLDGTTVWSKKIETEEDFTNIVGDTYNNNKYFLTGHVAGNFKSKIATMIFEDKLTGSKLLEEPPLIAVDGCGYHSVSITSNVKGNIAFYDQRGRKIIERYVDKPTTTISDFIPGFFIYRFISNNGETQTGKVIVK